MVVKVQQLSLRSSKVFFLPTQVVRQHAETRLLFTFSCFPEIAASFNKAVHFNTFGGNPVAGAIASSVLDVSIDRSCRLVQRLFSIVVEWGE